MIHIYTAECQPATNFVEQCGEKEIRFQFRPRKLLWCEQCQQRRWAAHLVVQVYYDGVRFWCAPGHGCRKGAT